MTFCKGYCDRPGAVCMNDVVRVHHGSFIRYGPAIRYCTACTALFEFRDAAAVHNYCPCCGQQLRTLPHNSTSRKKRVVARI